MAFRQLTAYLEDLQTIQISLEERFYAQSLRFFLSEKNTAESNEIPLIASEYYQANGKHIYKLHLMQAIDLDKHYVIHDSDRNHTPLQWGAIVRTPAFDEHFYYSGNDLGPRYDKTQTTFKVWAPISEQVLVVIDHHSQSMRRSNSGVWEATVVGDLDGQAYYYLHLVNGQWQETQDPYALSCLSNTGRSVVINPEKLRKPTTSFRNTSPINNAIIYEMSVRDFSADPKVPFQYPKKFLGLTESPVYQGQKLGFDYIQNLGITHIQLMPIYDFGSVDENKVDTVYNWGYDPMLYNVPDGSFATDPHDPYARIVELQDTINTYHQAGIGVIMDVVYNHVYDVDHFVFEKIVPGYCSRFDLNQKRHNGTGCGNDMASERLMIRKFIIDSLLLWVNYYGIDGFRFDLMGILDIQTMLEAEAALREIYPNIYLYGEGWQMGTGLETGLLAHQFNSYQMPGIGFFNDRFRDEFKKMICHPQLLVTKQKQAVVEELLTGSFGVVEANGRYKYPSQTINYIECHDNATFFDYLSIHHPGLSQSEKEARASLALQIVLLSQGVAFVHSGQEAFRTKDLIDNTYNQPDTINRLDWTRIVENRQHVEFISQLIQFRKEHPVLSLLTASEMQEQLDCYWLTDTVLKYTLVAQKETLQVILNLGSNDYCLENTHGLALYIQAPEIHLTPALESSPATIKIPAMSLAVLKGFNK
ncbi:type I pullulanase [Streptococcus ovuberis]|uniref:Type I pullulanase n=1 Tax=Streptococcus ovuberis TaxID=1936207 RepID=A0A7X6MZN6_9STRE|nr:type I pullulanase [Streptococcus ovuberis]NKZ21387.1 type I pullulanase [Streptococcus ovuberis]